MLHTLCRSQEVKEALRAQMEMQRSLHEQVEVTLTAPCMLSDKNDLLINISIVLWTMVVTHLVGLEFVAIVSLS